MPDLDEALFAAGEDEVFAAIEDGVVGGTIALNVLVCGVAVHGLEVHEAADGLVALVLCLEGVLQDLADVKLIKVGALN